jgi:hypothetical protein
MDRSEIPVQQVINKEQFQHMRKTKEMEDVEAELSAMMKVSKECIALLFRAKRENN